jgi:hypothetical protein
VEGKGVGEFGAGMRILYLWLEGGRLLLIEGYASKRLLVSALMESEALLMYMMVDCYLIKFDIQGT